MELFKLEEKNLLCKSDKHTLITRINLPKDQESKQSKKTNLKPDISAVSIVTTSHEESKVLTGNISYVCKLYSLINFVNLLLTLF